MNLKYVFAVIIIAILIGVGIVWLEKNYQSKSLTSITNSFANNIPINKSTPTPIPTSTPLPTLTPITSSSDLNQEIQTLTPPDFSSDFVNLKTEINSL